MSIPSRAEALDLLHDYTEGENLRRHALAVESAMRHYARHFREDEDLWGVVGLLHDFDYERYPTAEDHPYKGIEVLEQRGYDEVIRRAILSHAPYTNVARVSNLEKSLFAVDELCGLITAVALVRPDKQLASVKVKSVKKKLKDKAFARTVDRDHIRDGTAALGIDLDTHIHNVLTAMQEIATDLGL